MLFVPCINKTALVTLCLILLSACGSTPKTEEPETRVSDKNATENNLQTISKDIVGMVDISLQNQQSILIGSSDKVINQALMLVEGEALDVRSYLAGLKKGSFKKARNLYSQQQIPALLHVPKHTIDTYQQALTLMDDKNWLAADKLFDVVIEQSPHLSASYLNKALVLQELANDENNKVGTQAQSRAIKKSIHRRSVLIDKAISVNTLNPYAYYFKGQLQQQQGLFQQAEQSYAQALYIWPNYSDAQLSMAVLLELYRGKLLEAYRYYSAYLTLQQALVEINQTKQNQAKTNPAESKPAELKSTELKRVRRWQAALAIKIKRAGLTVPVQMAPVQTSPIQMVPTTALVAEQMRINDLSTKDPSIKVGQ